jgi:AcrR family transcriptional regulator
MEATTSTPAETRQRLIDAAGEIFAEQGRSAARVRDICERAGANIAAVNYHFRDKDSLYLECVRHARAYLRKQFPMDEAASGQWPAEQRLRAYVRTFLLRFLDAAGPQWHGKLLTREMFEPTGALDEAIEDTIRPQAELLTSIVEELAEHKLSRREARLCAESVTAQCLFYRDARSILLKLTPGREIGGEAVACLTQHITRFSLGAIRDLVAGRTSAPQTPDTAACEAGKEKPS